MDITTYPRTPRLINRFSLGADPEFVFIDKLDHYMYAENLGLNTLQAFGCDMAGRQAELRAHPSKFALRVVASLVDTLRWMAYAHPTSVTYKWAAMAFNGRDGIGGHVHFGRRRPDLEHDKVILDTTTMTLLGLGVINKSFFDQRVRETRAYGGYGDVRRQSHGYEYRTLPTQMASPWMFYFTLVLNKLVLYQGSAWKPLPANAAKEVTALFEKFADRDDDAAIALKALKLYGLPRDVNTDFKQIWGVETNPYLLSNKVDPERLFFPSTIRPQEETCNELFDFLVQGTAIPKRIPSCTWTPYALPLSFFKVAVSQHTLGHAPDIAMNLISRRHRVRVTVSNTLTPYISHDKSIELPEKEIQKALKATVSGVKFYVQDIDGIEIHIPPIFNKTLASCKHLHEVLGNPSLFPVCRARDLTSVDWSRWDVAPSKKEKASLGKLLVSVKGVETEKDIKKPVKTTIGLGEAKIVRRFEYDFVEPAVQRAVRARIGQGVAPGPVAPQPVQQPFADPEFNDEEVF